MRVDSNIQALGAIGLSMRVHGNNVANVNTDGFKYSTANYETGPEGEGVRVASIEESTSQGAFIPKDVLVEDAAGQVESTQEYVEASNTDLSREMVGMMSGQHAYEANIAAIKTVDEMNGHVLNLLV